MLVVTILLSMLAAPRAALSVGPPDAAISASDISFSNDYPKTGETVTINVTVHNAGGMDSGVVTVRFYLGQELFPFAEKDIGNIQMNTTGQTSATTIATLPGTYTVYVKVNCTADTNPGNNQAQKTFTVSAGGTLDVTAKLEPSSCKPGQSFNVTGTVKLLGQAVSGAEVKVSVKPSGTPVSTQTIADGSFMVNLTAPATADREAYEVEASAASGNLKGNATKTLTVVIPDIAMIELTFSTTSPTEGDSVKLAATIRNNGTDTAEKIDVAFYYDSTKIGTKTVDSLNAGNSTTVTIGWTAVKGSHTMKALADPDTKIQERTRDNNAVTSPLTVKEKPGGLGDNGTVMIIAAAVVVVAVVVVALASLRMRKGKKA